MRNNKALAIKFRQKGSSYNEISKKLGIPKSTLSYWFSGIKFSEIIKKNNISHAKKIWAENIIKYNKKRSIDCRKRWEVMQKKSFSDIRRISDYELLLIGAALYWAEGYKKTNWNLVFCNADPEMIKIMIRFFIKICDIPKEKIKAQVQIHKNISSDEAVDYWRKIIKFPKEQFAKSIYQISKASKNKRGNLLPYGTLRLKINDVVLVNKIKGWIEGLKINY